MPFLSKENWPENHTNTVPASKMLLSLAALGVVFGDIGTSPLYTFKTVLQLAGGATDVPSVLGSLSLILWTLIMVTTVKYVSVAMRIDNDGEGGILALMSLLGIKRKMRPAIVSMGLIGAALIYGDGAITPAISVLSALEGLTIIAPHLQAYVLPSSVAILVALFMIQPHGTARIGRAFGPIMALWFITIAVLGIGAIAQHVTVLAAINPLMGLKYLFTHGKIGFLVLGGVFLCVTGAEALYADMGHFGAKPIRFVWSWLVFPSLFLNYAGQAALVLDGAPIGDNIFYRLCPQALLLPLVILATVATIIASQSIITGAFSMTRQAMNLGWLPRMQVTQTSAQGYGQIYVGVVNWLLMIATISLTVGFGKSDNLASAYGIAVSATMFATSVLLFIAMREIWQWNLIKAIAVAGVFMVIDASFFIANLSKLLDGGYVPIILATLVYGVMYIWHTGIMAVAESLQGSLVPVDVFMAQIAAEKVVRVPGTAVFLTRTGEGTPPVMMWHAKHNHVLHEHLFILNVRTQSVPWVRDQQRISVQELAPNVWRAVANYGFMERPDIPKLLRQSHAHGCRIGLDNVVYYVGHETMICGHDAAGVPRWMEGIFAFLQRNSMHAGDYFRLPAEAVVEIGRQVVI